MVDTLKTKVIGNNCYELVGIKNHNGHVFYQFKINGVVRWYFKAYKYMDNGIDSVKISAPYGIEQRNYEQTIDKLISFFKVAWFYATLICVNL